MILVVQDLITIHQRIIQKTGGTEGVRNYALLDSSLQSIYQTFDGIEIYPTIIEKATRLCFQLNQNHPFIDGNKRISMHMLGLFLRFYELHYAPKNQEVIEISLSLSKGELDYPSLLTWVRMITSR